MKKVLITGALLLGGCANTLNFQPTMASDPPQLGIEGIALATELSKAYQRQDNEVCKSAQLGYQESRKHTVARYRNGRTDAAELFRCIGFRDDPDKKAVASHTKAGWALSDYFCDNFFERIAEHSSKRRFGRNTTNDVGALVSTILGLAAAGSGVTGGISAGFGLADSSWRNYDESFLVYADLPALQKLVHAEQDKFRKRAKDKMPDNYPDATNSIIRYANLCSFVGMKGLLTESMIEKAAGNANPLDGSRIRAAVEGDINLRRAIRDATQEEPVDSPNPPAPETTGSE